MLQVISIGLTLDHNSVLGSLIDPDLTARSARKVSPSIKKLMLAELQDALRLVVRSRSYGISDSTRDEAALWVGSNEDEHPFSFISVCSALSLDPQWVRSLLKGVPHAKQLWIVRQLLRALEHGNP